MEAAFWHERWQQNLIGFHLPEVNPYLPRFWSALAAPAKGRVFVPLCGKSLDMLWLAGEGYEVVGVEVSPIAVEAFFAENGLTPVKSVRGELTAWQADAFTLICGDFFKLTPADLGPIAAVYDRASLVALPPEMRRDYAAHLASLCPANIPRLLVTLDYDQGVASGPPFAVSEQEVRDIYSAGFDVETVFSENIIEKDSKFKEKGLKSLVEAVFVLKGKRK